MAGRAEGDVRRKPSSKGSISTDMVACCSRAGRRGYGWDWFAEGEAVAKIEVGRLIRSGWW